MSSLKNFQVTKVHFFKLVSIFSRSMWFPPYISPIIVHMYVFACALVAVGQSCVIWFLQDALYLFVTKSASQIPIPKSMGLAHEIRLLKTCAGACQDDQSGIIFCQHTVLFTGNAGHQTSSKRIVFQKFSFQSLKNTFSVALLDIVAETQNPVHNVSVHSVVILKGV
jgi:hypothetical protein